MNAIRAFARELLSLFVDDGSLALAILAVVALTAAALRLGAPPDTLGAALLALGLLAALAENLHRSARRLKRRE